MMEVFFLGTGGVYPTFLRRTTSIVVRIKGELVMFDCGEGIQVPFVPTFGVNKPLTILISHLHGDHVLGLPGLLLTFNLLGRENPLLLIGPPGLRKFVHSFMEILGSKLNYKIEIKEISDAENLIEVYSRPAYRIYAIAVRHTAKAFSYILCETKPRGRFNVDRAFRNRIPRGPLWNKLQKGLSVRVSRDRIAHPEDVLDNYAPGLKLVYTGDTKPALSLLDVIWEADLLIHDATFSLREFSKALEAAHCTAFHLGELAENARVKRVALIHLSPRYSNLIHILYREIKSIYRGEVLIPFDGFYLRVK